MENNLLVKTYAGFLNYAEGRLREHISDIRKNFAGLAALQDNIAIKNSLSLQLQVFISELRSRAASIAAFDVVGFSEDLLEEIINRYQTKLVNTSFD